MACDDSYIHFKIVKNLWEYGQPFFDPAETVHISSSPIWIFFLSILYKLPGELSFWITLTNCLIISFIAYGWCRICELNGLKSYWLAYILVFAVIHIGALDQMETPLACGLFFGAFLLLKLKKFISLSVICALLPYIRPEFIIASLILCVYTLIKHPNRKVIVLLGILFLIVFTLLINWIFGALIPHSIYAKSIIYDVSHTLSFNDLLPGRDDWPLAVRLLPMSVLLLLTRLDNFSKVIGLFGFLLLVSYVAKHTFIFSWYTCLLHLPLAFIGFHYAQRDRTSLLLIIFLNMPHLIELGLNMSSHYTYELRSARVKSYLKLSKILSKHTNVSTKLMVAEIGAISQTYKGKIIDGAGLASPTALKFHPMNVPSQRLNGSIAAIPKQFFEENKPDLLLAYDLFITDVSTSHLLKDYFRLALPVFGQEWINKLGDNKTFWSSRHLNLLVRKDFHKIDSLITDLKNY